MDIDEALRRVMVHVPSPDGGRASGGGCEEGVRRIKELLEKEKREAIEAIKGEEVNALGGRQARIESGFHLGFPARGVLEVAKVVKAGAGRYGAWNWSLISTEDHVNHAMEHLMRWLALPVRELGGDEEDHLAHAATRLLMALDLSVMQRVAGEPCASKREGGSGV